MPRARRWRTVILYGFLAWLIPFVAAIAIAPIRASNRPLFESVMPIVVTACATFFAARYTSRFDAGGLLEAAGIGATWMAMSVALDLPMFSAGPMKMSLAQYAADIGVAYLIFPVVAAGFGWSASPHRAPAGG